MTTSIKLQVGSRVLLILAIFYVIILSYKNLQNLVLNENGIPNLIGILMGLIIRVLYILYLLGNCVHQIQNESIQYRSAYKIGFLLLFFSLYALTSISYDNFLDINFLVALVSTILTTYILLIDGIHFYKSKRKVREFKLRRG